MAQSPRSSGLESLASLGAVLREEEEEAEEPLAQGPGFFSRWFRARSPDPASALASQAPHVSQHVMGGERRPPSQASPQAAPSATGSQTSLDSVAGGLVRKPSLTAVREKVTAMMGKRAEAEAHLDPVTGKPLKDYNASNFKQYWMPDWRSKECFECGEKFTTLRRRHHCRICGQIFCSRCCSKEIPGPTLGYVGTLRLCNGCAENVRASGLLHGLSTASLASHRSLSGASSMEAVEGTAESSPSPVVDKPTTVVNAVDNPAFSHKAWPFASDSGRSASPSRRSIPAAPLGAATPVALRDLEHGPEREPDWVASIPQTPTATQLVTSTPEASPEESPVTRADESSFDMCDEASSVDHPPRPRMDRAATQIVREVGSDSLPSAVPSPPREPVSVAVSSASSAPTCSAAHLDVQSLFDERGSQLVHYLLAREHLDDSAWFPVLWPLARQVALTVQPDIPGRRDEMDVLRYVHVKTLTSSRTPKASLVHGVIATGKVADVRMRQSFDDPAILLISEGLEYDRKGGRLNSLEPILAQERVALASAVGKVHSFAPDLLVVHKSVAHIAQQLLRETGTTLVSSIKERVLNRIARSTEGEKVGFIEGQLRAPKLGRCGHFRAETHKLVGGGRKNLLFFTDCPRDLGVSLLLTGPNSGELRRAKRAMRFAVFALYSGKLEMALLDSVSVCVAEDTLRRAREESGCKICSDNRSEDASEKDNACGGLSSALPAASLSASPFLSVGLPFLETGAGRSSRHADYFRGLAKDGMYRYRTLDEIASSPPVAPDPPLDAYPMTKARLAACPSHPFLGEKLRGGASTKEVQGQLARYRAEAARMFRESLSKAKKDTEEEQRAAREKQAEAGGPTDVLSPYQHRRLAVLFASFSAKSENAPEFCIDPWVALMSYYGRADLPLGDFLTRYCFNKDYMCPKIRANDTKHCEVTMLEHTRKIAHRHACLEITTQTIMEDEKKGKESEAEGSGILVWDWCKECKATTAATRMSQALWHLSFAKYLSYLFSAVALPTHVAEAGDGLCGHCAFHQHDHYFALANYVASFKITRLRLFEVALCPMEIRISPSSVGVRSLVDESKAVSELASAVFTDMLEQTCALKDHEDALPYRPLLNELVAASEQGQTAFRDRLSSVQEHLTSLAPIATRELSSDDPACTAAEDGLSRTRQLLSTTLLAWNSLVAEWRDVKKRAAMDHANHAKDSRKEAKESAKDAAKSPAKPPKPSPDSLAPDTEATPSSSITPDGSPAKRPSGDGHEGDKVEEAAEDKAPIRKAPSSNRLLEKVPFPACLKTIQSPFPPGEHYALPCGRLPVIVRDGEVGSILAHALVSPDYHTQTNAIRKRFGYAPGAEDQPDIVKVPLEMSADLLGSSSPHHIEIQFQDATSKYYVRVYYAEHFRVLRRLLMGAEGGEEAFIRSLSRSDGWTPKGGKSGASFFRTRDKRFIIKTMSTFEIGSFVKFAPAYFHYVATGLRAGKPSALCKVLGVFKVCWRNETTREQEKKDVLVMEYLFYGRPGIERVYDLKGSLRNRLTRGTGNSGQEEGWVEMDENMLKQAWSEAYHLRPHSRSLLSTAIHNDSHFLSTHHVMDYSLLVGVSRETGELTLGIIDYIRTYTLDKKMEFWVKSLAVPTSTLPTVVSPEMYRTRFTDAIEIYFPVAPDQWAGLSQGLQY